MVVGLPRKGVVFSTSRVRAEFVCEKVLQISRRQVQTMKRKMQMTFLSTIFARNWIHAMIFPSLLQSLSVDIAENCLFADSETRLLMRVIRIHGYVACSSSVEM